jgi:hypothetical protein
MSLHSKRLSTYLNDHLAGATGGLELAKRTRGSNKGTPYGEVLERLETEIGDDRETLKAIMDRLDVEKNQLKVSLGWMAEKVGRLKLNDQLVGYSPLSRLIEFEGLIVGVTAKLAVWNSLQHVAGGDGRLAEFDFADLIARAERQLSELEQLRVTAAHEALTEDAAVS